MTPIPLEIIDLITDMVYQSTNPIVTLKACATVSKRFYPRAQKHLFTFITLCFENASTLPATPFPPHHAAQPLLDALLLRPELARHIKHLNIIGFSEGYWISQGLDDDDMEDEDFCDVPDTVLPHLFEIIGKYANLQSFFFSGPSDISDDAIQSHYDRKPASYELRCSLLRMLARTRVSHVSLSSVSGIPLTTIVILCPELKRLQVEWTSGYDIGKDGSEEGEDDTELLSFEKDPGRLEALSVDERSVLCVRKLLGQAANGGTSASALSHLRELTVKGTTSSLLSIASDLISHAVETLESLTWEVKNSFVIVDLMSNDQINLASAAALRTLRFAFPECHSAESAFLPQLTDILSSLHGRNNLEAVVINYTAQAMPASPFHASSDREQNTWASSVCYRLACRTSFPHLRTVTVVVEYHEEEWSVLGGDAPLGSAMLALAIQLNGLRERGVLKLEWVPV
ncbi:hypothetical protein Hypma_012367 [Hypsizygus marmoreus]|uniref:F-box domain-containing protein n=1 Tax=Hypsizygus marmoreus TaxID=39966 RepID=A0A369KBC3_HYPMA|nr:hypothetical protein Hypma_012367 [Hypsizygus marmoreus]